MSQFLFPGSSEVWGSVLRWLRCLKFMDGTSLLFLITDPLQLLPGHNITNKLFAVLCSLSPALLKRSSVPTNLEFDRYVEAITCTPSLFPLELHFYFRTQRKETRFLARFFSFRIQSSAQTTILCDVSVRAKVARCVRFMRNWGQNSRHIAISYWHDFFLVILADFLCNFSRKSISGEKQGTLTSYRPAASVPGLVSPLELLASFLDLMGSRPCSQGCRILTPLHLILVFFFFLLASPYYCARCLLERDAAAGHRTSRSCHRLCQPRVSTQVSTW